MNSKVEISKRLVLINSSSSIVARVLSLSVLVWLQQYLLSRISTDEYSLYPVIISLVVLIPLLTTFLTVGIGRYIVDAYARGDEGEIVRIVSSMLPWVLGAGLALMLGGGIFSWYIDFILTIPESRIWDARIMMGLFVFSMALRVMVAPFGVGLYVRQKFVLTNVIDLAAELFRIGLLFLLLFGISTRVLWVVVASVLANLAGTLVKTVLSCRYVPALKFRLGEIDWNVTKRVVSFGGWDLLSRAAHMMDASMNPIILNKLATSLDVTCFHIGSLVRRQTVDSWLQISAPLLPPLTAMHSLNQKDRLKSIYLRGMKYSFWLSLALALPFIVFREEIVTLYVGNQFLTSAGVMGLLLSVLPLQLAGNMVAKLAVAMDRLRPWAIRTALIQVVNLALTLYWVGIGGRGAYGAALASFLTVAMGYSILVFPLGFKLAEVSPRQWMKESLGPGLLPGAVEFAILWGFQSMLKPASWTAIFAVSLLGSLCFLAVLLGFCMTVYEKKDLVLILRKIQSLFLDKGLCESFKRKWRL